MAYEAYKIGNTTIEQRSATLYSYNFPLLVVEVDTAQFANGAVIFNPIDAPRRVVDFDDIAQNFGTTDAKTYCDYLATNNYFGLPSATIDTTGLATSALQTTGNSTLSSILSALANLATSALQTTANGFLSTIAAWTASAATSALQTTGNGYLQTLANEAVAGNGTQTTHVVTNVVSTVLAADANRKGVMLYNAGGNDVFLRFGGNATLTEYTLLFAGNAYYEVPQWAAKSSLTVIKSGANQNMRVTTF